MVRTNQGGSVLGFIVVGVLLASLLTGGAYVVHRQTISSIVGGAQSQSTRSNSKSPSNSGSGDTTPTTNGSNGQQAPTPTPSSNTAPTSNTSQLPQTGPAETISTLFALGFLTSLAIAYYRSRRPALHFDLR